MAFKKLQSDVEQFEEVISSKFSTHSKVLRELIARKVRALYARHSGSSVKCADAHFK